MDERRTDGVSCSVSAGGCGVMVVQYSGDGGGGGRSLQAKNGKSIDSPLDTNGIDARKMYNRTEWHNTQGVVSIVAKWRM